MQKLTSLSRSVKGSTAIITGAASGIGRAVVQLFVDEGANVGLIDIDQAGLDSLLEEIAAVGGSAYAIACDCAVRDDLQTALQQLAEHFGAVDILVNNAGVALGSDINDPTQYEASWQQSLDVMVSAQQRAVITLLPWLSQSAQSSQARIINIASSEAMGATAFNSAYVAAKHASLGLTRALAIDLGKQGITVNCVCPGPVNTGMTAVIDDQDKATFARRRTALRRYAEPEEIAHAVLNLALPSSTYITGAAIVVDGGLTIRNA